MTNGTPATVAEPLDTTEFRDVEAQLKQRFPAAVLDVERGTARLTLLYRPAIFSR